MSDTLLDILLAVVGALALSASPLAHHAATAFDTSKEITLQGTVVSWAWANPHCILTFDVKDETGTLKHWAAETANPISMTQRGWSRSSFKAGDTVTLSLQPARNGEPVGILLTAVLPGGQKLVTGPPGSAIPPDK